MTARESQTALEHSTQIPFASHFYNAIGARTRVSGSFSSHRCFRQREWPLIGCDKDGALVAPEVPRPATEHAPAHTRPSSTPDSSAVPFLIWRRRKTRVCEWLVCQPDLLLPTHLCGMPLCHQLPIPPVVLGTAHLGSLITQHHHRPRPSTDPYSDLGSSKMFQANTALSALTMMTTLRYI